MSEKKRETGNAEWGEREESPAEHVRVVRIGHGGNCSSVGSVVDTLFVAAAVGGAVMAAVMAAMTKESKEKVRVVGGKRERGNES